MDIAQIAQILQNHGFEVTSATDATSVSGQKTTATTSESITVDQGGGMLWTRTERVEGQGQQAAIGGRTYEVITQDQRDTTVRYQAGAQPSAPLTFQSPASTQPAASAPAPALDQALDVFLHDMENGSTPLNGEKRVARQ